jgi:hypothetical protein
MKQLLRNRAVRRRGEVREGRVRFEAHSRKSESSGLSEISNEAYPSEESAGFLGVGRGWDLAKMRSGRIERWRSHQSTEAGYRWTECFLERTSAAQIESESRPHATQSRVHRSRALRGDYWQRVPNPVEGERTTDGVVTAASRSPDPSASSSLNL